MNKNMVFVLLLACVPMRADCSKWKYGTAVAGAGLLTGVGVCVYNIIKINEVKRLLQEEGLGKEEIAVLVKKLQTHKKWAWGSGIVGLLGLLGVGLCWHKANEVQPEPQPRPEPQPGPQPQLPRVPSRLGRRVPLTLEQVKLAQTLGYANLALNDQINPTFDDIEQHFLNDLPESIGGGWFGQHLWLSFRNTYVADDYRLRDMERGGESVANRNRLIEQGKVEANGLLQRGTQFLVHFRQNRDEAIRGNTGNFFPQGMPHEDRERVVQFLDDLPQSIPATFADL